jgi:hypothetical protein
MTAAEKEMKEAFSRRRRHRQHFPQRRWYFIFFWFDFLDKSLILIKWQE